MYLLYLRGSIRETDTRFSGLRHGTYKVSDSKAYIKSMCWGVYFLKCDFQITRKNRFNVLSVIQRMTNKNKNVRWQRMVCHESKSQFSWRNKEINTAILDLTVVGPQQQSYWLSFGPSDLIHLSNDTQYLILWWLYDLSSLTTWFLKIFQCILPQS